MKKDGRNGNLEAQHETSPKLNGKQVIEDCETEKGKLIEHESSPLVVDSPSLVTVFLAAPALENHRLAITGIDERLGKWKIPKGDFVEVSKIDKEFSIFKGMVPVPEEIGSPFKFIHFHTAESKIMYEGDGKSDNRTEELLPDSWNFFIFKPKAKGALKKVWTTVVSLISRPETGEKIAMEYFHIVFGHALETLLPNWDDAFEFIDESLQKIRRAVERDSYTAGFYQFLNQWIEKPELQVNFDLLMLLLVGASKMNAYFNDKIKQLLQLNSEQFSVYLHKFKHMKRKKDDLLVIMERIAVHAGQEFVWIFFRIHRQSQIPKEFNHPQVSESVIKTLQNIPEVLLDEPECVAKVVEYLVRWNDINKLYLSMLPVFDKNAEYQRIFEPLLLEKFIYQHKSSIDDLIKILNSDIMKKTYQNISISGLDEISREHSRTNIFQDSIKDIFNQHKLSDVITLALHTPECLLTFIDNIVIEKMGTISNFNKEDYNFFALQSEHDNLEKFPRTKQQIEAILLRMAKGHLKLGLLQSIPSKKLILLALAERKDILFLKRAKVTDLQKAINTVPGKFFQNLYTCMKPSGSSVEKTLTPYRKGKTKDVVERLETHFKHIDAILAQVQNRRVPLTELTTLKVCKHPFLYSFL